MEKKLKKIKDEMMSCKIIYISGIIIWFGFLLWAILSICSESWWTIIPAFFSVVIFIYIIYKRNKIFGVIFKNHKMLEKAIRICGDKSEIKEIQRYISITAPDGWKMSDPLALAKVAVSENRLDKIDGSDKNSAKALIDILKDDPVTNIRSNDYEKYINILVNGEREDSLKYIRKLAIKGLKEYCGYLYPQNRVDYYESFFKSIRKKKLLIPTSILIKNQDNDILNKDVQQPIGALPPIFHLIAKEKEPFEPDTNSLSMILSNAIRQLNDYDRSIQPQLKYEMVALLYRQMLSFISPHTVVSGTVASVSGRKVKNLRISPIAIKSWHNLLLKIDTNLKNFFSQTAIESKKEESPATDIRFNDDIRHKYFLSLFKKDAGFLKDLSLSDEKISSLLKNDSFDASFSQIFMMSSKAEEAFNQCKAVFESKNKTHPVLTPLEPLLPHIKNCRLLASLTSRTFLTLEDGAIDTSDMETNFMLLGCGEHKILLPIFTSAFSLFNNKNTAIPFLEFSDLQKIVRILKDNGHENPESIVASMCAEWNLYECQVKKKRIEMEQLLINETTQD